MNNFVYCSKEGEVMRKIITLVFILTVSFSLSVAQSDTVFTIRKLTDQIYQLSTDEGAYTTNALLFTGKDGLLKIGVFLL